MVNTFGVKTLRYLNNTCVVLHSAGVISIAIIVLAKAPAYQSVRWDGGRCRWVERKGDPGVRRCVRSSDVSGVSCYPLHYLALLLN